MSLPADIVRAFAPSGRLHAAINTGNPILAAADVATGVARGVSVDLARGFAARLGVALDLLVFDTAAKSVDAVIEERADIGFFAIDPKRGEGHPLHRGLCPDRRLLRWCARDSPLAAVDEVDRAGTPGRRRPGKRLRLVPRRRAS